MVGHPEEIGLREVVDFGVLRAAISDLGHRDQEEPRRNPKDPPWRRLFLLLVQMIRQLPEHAGQSRHQILRGKGREQALGVSFELRVIDG